MGEVGRSWVKGRREEGSEGKEGKMGGRGRKRGGDTRHTNGLLPAPLEPHYYGISTL